MQLAKAGEFSTWLLTGTAAILGAVVANIDPIAKVMDASNFRWEPALLVGSTCAGRLFAGCASC
ncbi:protein of unknown function [Methylocaldum szegediense]|uniref:Uncharacterized protein n=1 Tax=Methylocaldum szegediense TaxID=73780 RepID=A0ABN8X7I7_9GAMM|nr:protein of unknown function [Methylocaldum szegediense]